MGISGASFGIGGGEDGVDKNKGTDDFSSQASAFVVPITEHVGAAIIPHVVRRLESLNQPTATDSTRTLSYHVQHGPNQRHLPCQEQPKGHCWVYVATGDPGGAVDEDEDHAAKGPGDAEDSDAVTWVFGDIRVTLVGVADNSQNGDVEEEESGDELGDGGSVK